MGRGLWAAAFFLIRLPLLGARPRRDGDGAGGGDRTHTRVAPDGILSPARLPVPPLRRAGYPSLWAFPSMATITDPRPFRSADSINELKRRPLGNKRLLRMIDV